MVHASSRVAWAKKLMAVAYALLFHWHSYSHVGHDIAACSVLGSNALCFPAYVISVLIYRHRATHISAFQADLDIPFLVRVLLLATLAGVGAALQIVLRLASVSSKLGWVIALYNVSLPVISSLLFVGMDVLLVWKRWLSAPFRRGQKRVEGAERLEFRSRLDTPLSRPSMQSLEDSSVLEGKERDCRTSVRNSVASNHLSGPAGAQPDGSSGPVTDTTTLSSAPQHRKRRVQRSATDTLVSTATSSSSQRAS